MTAEEPSAGEATPETYLLYCYSCGHAWSSRGEKLPKRCPHCRSSRWDQPVKKETECKFCGHHWRLTSINEKCPACGQLQIIGTKERSLYCNQCDHVWIQRRAQLPKKCPLCRSADWNKPKAHRLVCSRCGHVWKNQSENPQRCPNCQSTLWNVPRPTLQCRRCGHKWTLKGRRRMEDVKICPKCKSAKWNEAPKVFVCSICGKTQLLKANQKLMACPHCNSHQHVYELNCPFCGYVWNVELMNSSQCPLCKTVVTDEVSAGSQTLDIWTEGNRVLRYTSSNGFGFIYLWEGLDPVTTIYFHEACRQLAINAEKFIEAINTNTLNETFKKLANSLYEHRDDYKQYIPYFQKRLNLSELDARILAIHFIGMGPEAIALKFKIPYEQIRDSFERIMAAFTDSGIAVDDTVFTENPFDYY